MCVVTRLEVEYLDPNDVAVIFSPVEVTSATQHLDVQPIYVKNLHFTISPFYYKYQIKPKKLTISKTALSRLLEISEEEVRNYQWFRKMHQVYVLTRIITLCLPYVYLL